MRVKEKGTPPAEAAVVDTSEAEFDAYIEDCARFRRETQTLLREQFPQLESTLRSILPADVFRKAGIADSYAHEKDQKLFTEESEGGAGNSVKRRGKSGSGTRPHEIRTQAKSDIPEIPSASTVALDDDDEPRLIGEEDESELDAEDPNEDLNLINPESDYQAQVDAAATIDYEGDAHKRNLRRDREVYGERQKMSDISTRNRLETEIADREISRLRLEDDLNRQRVDDELVRDRANVHPPDRK